jgi:hypothetical protein
LCLTSRKKKVYTVTHGVFWRNIDPNTGEKRKPEMKTEYNNSKGGIGNVDEMVEKHNFSRKYKR